MTSSQEQSKALVTEPTEMNIYGLPDKEFRVSIFFLKEIQKNSGKQLNK